MCIDSVLLIDFDNTLYLRWILLTDFYQFTCVSIVHNRLYHIHTTILIKINYMYGVRNTRVNNIYILYIYRERERERESVQFSLPQFF